MEQLTDQLREIEKQALSAASKHKVGEIAVNASVAALLRSAESFRDRTEDQVRYEKATSGRTDIGYLGEYRLVSADYLPLNDPGIYTYVGHSEENQEGSIICIGTFQNINMEEAF